MEKTQLQELLLQSLAHERGGVEVYETALRCVQNGDLKKEWTKYHEQTLRHVTILQQVCQSLEIDPAEETPGVRVIKGLGKALVTAMQQALSAGNPAAAEIVAAECVVIAETKDHLDWELISSCAREGKGSTAKVLKPAAEEVEEQEDEHLYHSKGWCRELWLKSLGLKAVLPPPEEQKDVKTAIGAARAEKAAHPH